jgi:hypothetical protein
VCVRARERDREEYALEREREREREKEYRSDSHEQVSNSQFRSGCAYEQVGTQDHNLYTHANTRVHTHTHTHTYLSMGYRCTRLGQGSLSGRHWLPRLRIPSGMLSVGYLAYVYLAVCLAVGIKVFVGELAVNACVYVR